MIKDIEFPEIKKVSLAIAQDEDQEWRVYIVNENAYTISNVLVTSRGYGSGDQEGIRTSTLRHFIGEVDAKSFRAIEVIKENVFNLNNEYWVSFYAKERLFDKKYIFVTGSISPENLSLVPLLGLQGILHP